MALMDRPEDKPSQPEEDVFQTNPLVEGLSLPNQLKLTRLFRTVDRANLQVCRKYLKMTLAQMYRKDEQLQRISNKAREISPEAYRNLKSPPSMDGSAGNG